MSKQDNGCRENTANAKELYEDDKRMCGGRIAFVFLLIKAVFFPEVFTVLVDVVVASVGGYEEDVV